MALVENPSSPLIAQLKGVHLFHFEGAPCAQRVRFALAEKGLRRGNEVPWNSHTAASLTAADGTWTSRHVSLIKKDHLSAEYAAIQPNMVVPALIHDGKLHIESMEILDYLDERWPDNPLTPEDPQTAAETRRLVDWGKQLHISVRYVSFHWGLGRLGRLSAKEEAKLKKLERKDSPEKLNHFYSRFDHGSIDQATYHEHLTALENGYQSLEDQLRSDGREFLTGAAFSAADIIWSIKVLRISECGYPFKRNFPALFEWYSRVSQRAGFQDGVMAKHRGMSRAFRVKSTLENLVGVGLQQAARQQAAA
jgi:glutathione S-transferase